MIAHVGKLFRIYTKFRANVSVEISGLSHLFKVRCHRKDVIEVTLEAGELKV